MHRVTNVMRQDGQNTRLNHFLPRPTTMNSGFSVYNSKLHDVDMPCHVQNT